MNTSISFHQAIDRLRSGQVGVLPTDTVMGLVASADNPEAVTRMYDLKQREGKPGTIIAPDTTSLVQLGLNRQDITRVAHFWPNPISVVLRCENEQLSYLHQGKYSLAVRIPRDTDVRALLNRTGPLATTSANLPGEAPAQTLQQAREYFADAVDFYVAPKQSVQVLSSTVVDATSEKLTVLRQGAVILDTQTGDIV